VFDEQDLALVPLQKEAFSPQLSAFPLLPGANCRKSLPNSQLEKQGSPLEFQQSLECSEKLTAWCRNSHTSCFWFLKHEEAGSLINREVL
jgi:hypothetical protein